MRLMRLGLALGTLAALVHAEIGRAQEPFLPDFAAATFSDSLNISNPYHPLIPGQVRTYTAEETDPDTGELSVETIVVEVLNETRTVLGVEARVVRDRVIVDGLPIEDTFDWFAQDDEGNVWYMGEDVTDFIYDDNGILIEMTHPGMWEAGVDGALPGYQMPASPQPGEPFRQEFYLGEAEDVGQILGIDEMREVPGFGTFDNVVRTADTSVLDPDALEHKFYAPGIGKIATDKIDPESGAILGGERLITFVPEPSSGLLVLSATLLGLRSLRRRLA